MDEHGRRHFLRSGAFSVITPNLLTAKAAAQAAPNDAATADNGVTAAQVERAIRAGVSFLKKQQSKDGSWLNLRNQHQHPAGTTALMVHALLTAGEPADSPTIGPALDYLAQFTPDEIDGNYAVGLLTMVFTETDPKKYAPKIAANVAWAESVQVREGEGVFGGWSGLWSHTSNRRSEKRPADDSSTQYALLGLDAAARAGFAVDPEVWRRCRTALRRGQLADGGWAYHPHNRSLKSTSSMTVAGICGLILTDLWAGDEGEQLANGVIEGCGRNRRNQGVERGLAWLSRHFSVRDNVNALSVGQWRYYYLYGLERAARLAGVRYIGGRDWYREGAEELLASQDPLLGSWKGEGTENQPTLATSLALLFLATGRTPLLIQKLRHGPADDWNNDPHDVRRLVAEVSTEWKHSLTWQTADVEDASVEELSEAPIIFFNGHRPPALSPEAKVKLRKYIEQGGFLFAEACCGSPDFDAGFRTLLNEMFPDAPVTLRPLSDDHAVWRARHPLTPAMHPLWGMEYGCRTAVIYSPDDLSCGWQQMDAHPSEPIVVKAKLVGQNVVDYATGRQPPPDKLAAREAVRLDAPLDVPRRGVLRLAKLRHPGDWNIAPRALTHLADALRRPPLNFQVHLEPYELSPTDPNLIYYPLIYIHGRSGMNFTDIQADALRRHVHPGGGVFFADAACGGAAFDVSFRLLMKRLFPDFPLTPIPKEDPIYTSEVGFDLSESQFNIGAGGGVSFPYLEGVQIDGRWAVIYSKFDLGCALERHTAIDCQGYSYESALKIAVNIVLYASQHP